MCNGVVQDVVLTKVIDEHVSNWSVHVCENKPAPKCALHVCARLEIFPAIAALRPSAASCATWGTPCPQWSSFFAAVAASD